MQLRVLSTYYLQKFSTRCVRTSWSRATVPPFDGSNSFTEHLRCGRLPICFPTLFLRFCFPTLASWNSWKFSSWEECGSCRSRQALSNGASVAKFGFDTAENGPFKVWERRTSPWRPSSSQAVLLPARSPQLCTLIRRIELWVRLAFDLAQIYLLSKKSAIFSRFWAFVSIFGMVIRCNQ